MYRSVAGVWELSPIAIFPSFTGVLVYEDNIARAFYGNGEFCYKLIANEGEGVHVDNSIPASSSSNEACVIQNPVLYVPNAFNPSELWHWLATCGSELLCINTWLR